MSCRTFARFSRVVAAASKYQFRSGCLKGVNSTCCTRNPTASHNLIHVRGVKRRLWLGSRSFFDRVRPFLGFGLLVFHRAVNQQEVTAGFENAGGFTDKLFGRTEMMRGDAAGDQIKSRVGVGELLPPRAAGSER